MAGASASRLDQPMEFRESRKDVDAMLADVLTVVAPFSPGQYP